MFEVQALESRMSREQDQEEQQMMLLMVTTPMIRVIHFLSHNLCVADSSKWMLDSGAIYHICSRFSSYEKLDGGVSHRE